MTNEFKSFEERRRAMVADQLVARGIRDRRVLAAMAELPRERFVPPEMRELAYEDRPLPIGAGQTISQPYVVALMTQELALAPDHRVLDIGAGSGYQAAVLARLVRHVYAIERLDELTQRASAVLAELGIANVTLVTGDGTLGWPEQAPFDRIMCGAGGPDVPREWARQLVDGGRIVMPVGGEQTQTLVAVEKRGRGLTRREICGVRFVKLIGQAGWRPEVE